MDPLEIKQMECARVAQDLKEVTKTLHDAVTGLAVTNESVKNMKESLEIHASRDESRYEKLESRLARVERFAWAAIGIATVFGTLTPLAAVFLG